MKKNIFTLFAVLLALGLGCMIACAANSQTFNAVQQKQIEQIIHNYLIKNPEVLIEAIQALQQKQTEQTRKSIEKTQAIAPKFVDALFHQSSDPIAGNPQGTMTIVNFYDYQCPHCIQMTTVLDGLVKTHPELRIVFKDFPIRGAISDFAAKVSLAAKIQGKYVEFHKALMAEIGQKQQLTEDSIMTVAKTVGLDVDKLKTDMKTDAIAQQIKANLKLGQDLGLLGTPAYFIAKTNVTAAGPIKFIPGQAEAAQIESIMKSL